MLRALFPLLLLGCDVRPGYVREEVPWERDAPPDIPRDNARLRLDLFEFPEEVKGLVELAARFSDPSFPVAGAPDWGANGIVLVAGRRDFAAGFRAGTEGRRSAHRTSYLLAADGREGSFTIGRAQIVPDETAFPVVRGPARLRTYRLVPTATGLAFVARLGEGGPIDLDLVPWVADGDGREVRLVELPARLTMEPGRPYVFCGADGADPSLGGVLFARRAAAGPRRLVLALTVERR